MLTRLDDYPVHQTPEPVACAMTGDRNFYDRYFFNGFSRAGDLYFGTAMGLYPNRRVMDAAFTLVHAGRQHALHASRLAPAERTETRVGPIEVEVTEPLRVLRVRVASNPHGLEADLVFRARTPAVEEPRYTRRFEGRLFMDSTRLTQFGTWEGWVALEGRRIAIDPGRVLAVRDRSWGVRPVGEPETGPPGMPPQFFWLWAPVHFDDACTLVAVNEDADGRPWYASGSITRVPDGPIEEAAAVAHRIRWLRGTRRAAAAEVTLTSRGGEPWTITLEPLLAAQMTGLGYLHPEWGHGVWKGDAAIAGEAWDLTDVDPMVPKHLHVQQVCRARAGDRQGIGVLEQLVIGPHHPSGFRSILDAAEG